MEHNPLESVSADHDVIGLEVAMDHAFENGVVPDAEQDLTCKRTVEGFAILRVFRDALIESKERLR